VHAQKEKSVYDRDIDQKRPPPRFHLHKAIPFCGSHHSSDMILLYKDSFIHGQYPIESTKKEEKVVSHYLWKMIE